MLKKIAILFLSLLTVVLILTAAACGSGSTNSVSKSVVSQEAVPQKVNSIGGLSLSVLQDKNVRNAYDEMDKGPNYPATYDELLQTVRDKIGLELTDLKEAVVFADIPADAFSKDQNASTESYIGAIVKGTFKQDEMIAVIKKSLGHDLNSEIYKGYNIYVVKYDESSGISASDAAKMAFLDESNLVIGSDQAVKDVIDVRKGDAQGLSGELLNLYNGLGNPQAKLAIEVRAEWLSQIPDEQDSSEFGKLQLKAFKDMTMATLVMDQAGDTAITEIKVNFSNGDATNKAKDTIDGLVSMLQGFMKMTGDTNTPEATAITKLLDSLKVSISGNWLTLRLELTPEQIGELTPLFQGMFLQNSQ